MDRSKGTRYDQFYTSGYKSTLVMRETGAGDRDKERGTRTEEPKFGLANLLTIIWYKSLKLSRHSKTILPPTLLPS